MMLIGEALESLTLAGTRNAISQLMDLTPPMARIVHDDHLHEVPVEDVVVGDIVVVYAGERLPVDGLVVDGHSALDQSPITGESLPVDKGPDDKVFSGSMNLSGPISMRATGVGVNSTVGKIIAVVRDAQVKKGPAQKAADRFAGWFTPLVLTVGLVTWIFTGDIIRAVTVLIIACPCALVLATPTAVVASVGNAAKRGALIKGGVTVEKLARITTLVFDKTGTLTLGKPRVTAVQPFGNHTEHEVLRIAATIEQSSRHPLAQAVTAAAGPIPLNGADNVKELPGRGMSGEVEGKRVVIGTVRLLEESGVVITPSHRQTATDNQARGWTAVWVARDGQVMGLIALGDTIRPGAKEMLQEIAKSGVHEAVLLTGDNKGAAQHVARELGITRFFAEVLPTEKSDVIAALQKEGKRVSMVGDGINDGPALAVSDVGIAMGAAGSAIAIDTADIALLGDRLAAIPEVLRLGRRTYGIIQQNIYVFALAVNMIGMAVASLGLMDPIMAALVHNIASIFVVVNSSRLISVK
ncbi:MAG: Copper-exporting P-type ATPase A [Firmicutes bacterium]|nr:Copper-exporting P-type ATPase A [Bacillota bacterium]